MVLTTALATALVLGGCAQGTEISAPVAAQLQEDVQAVGNLAAAGDRAGALGVLDSLEAEARQAADAGSITARRLAAIVAAIGVVRTDLQAEPAPATDPSQPTTDPSEPATDDDSDEPADPGQKPEKKPDKKPDKKTPPPAEPASPSPSPSDVEPTTGPVEEPPIDDTPPTDDGTSDDGTSGTSGDGTSDDGTTGTTGTGTGTDTSAATTDTGEGSMTSD
jgi:outer membrane biosynthesis protein TonB